MPLGPFVAVAPGLFSQLVARCPLLHWPAGGAGSDPRLQSCAVHVEHTSATSNADTELLVEPRPRISAQHVRRVLFASLDGGVGARAGPGQCEFVVGQSASGDEVCVCVATDALRKLRFQANFSGRKGASGSRLRARGARANLGGRAVARRAATFW